MIIFRVFVLTSMIIMQLSILIVNENTENLIENFLLELKQQSLALNTYEIIIANRYNNQSLKDSISSNLTLNGLNIKVLEVEHDLGFGAAINHAAQHVLGDTLLIINPAVHIPQRDYLVQLLKHAENIDHYGLMSTRVIDRFNQDISTHLLYEFNHDLGFENQINWFSRDLLLIKKTVFEQVSGFDPDFYQYHEDQDLSLRIKLLQLPLIKLNDLEVRLNDSKPKPSLSYSFYQTWFKSKILFAYKHFTSYDYVRLLYQLELKSTKRSKIYSILCLTGITTFQHKKVKWTAIRDSIHKTINESAQWLYSKK